MATTSSTTASSAAPSSAGTQTSDSSNPSTEIKQERSLTDAKPAEAVKAVAAPIQDKETPPVDELAQSKKAPRKGPVIVDEEKRDPLLESNALERAKHGASNEAVVPSIDKDIRASLDRIAAHRALEFEQARRTIAPKRESDTERAETKAVVPNARLVDALDQKATSASAQKNTRKPLATSDVVELPTEVRESFVQVGDRFYDRNDTTRLAFVDKGQALKTASNDPDTAKAIVALADARGWTDIKAKGSEAFRREAYIEGTARGIRVAGYQPSPSDIAEIEVRARRFIERNAILRTAAVEFREVMAKDTNIASPEVATAALAARQAKEYAKSISDPAIRSLLTKGFQEQIAQGLERGAQARRLDDPSLRATIRVPEGEYIEAKAAKYNFDENEQQSFYVKYRDSKTGDVRVTWGKGLQDALAASQAQPGDVIRLNRESARAVQVNANIRDENSRIVDRRLIDAKRNDWKVDVVERKQSHEIQTTRDRDVARGR